MVESKNFPMNGHVSMFRQSYKTFFGPFLCPALGDRSHHQSALNQELFPPKLDQNGRSMAGMHKKLIPVNIIFGKYFVGAKRVKTYFYLAKRSNHVSTLLWRQRLRNIELSEQYHLVENLEKSRDGRVRIRAWYIRPL
jgi:hypothetical protein